MESHYKRKYDFVMRTLRPEFFVCISVHVWIDDDALKGIRKYGHFVFHKTCLSDLITNQNGKETKLWCIKYVFVSFGLIADVISRPFFPSTAKPIMKDGLLHSKANLCAWYFWNSDLVLFLVGHMPFRNERFFRVSIAIHCMNPDYDRRRSVHTCNRVCIW